LRPSPRSSQSKSPMSSGWSGQVLPECEIFIIHPGKRQGYKTLTNQTTKTDPLDAKTICKILSIWHNQEYRDDLEIHNMLFTSFKMLAPATKLRGLMAHYERLKQERASAKTRVNLYEYLEDKDQAEFNRPMAESKTPEKALEIARKDALSKFPEHLQALTSIHGVGDVLALHLLATLMPIERFVETTEKGDATLDNIKRYLGMSPQFKQSGSQSETKKEKGGHRHIRGLFYISAVGHASEKDTSCFGAFYRAQVARGFKGRKALNRVGHMKLRVCISLLRHPRPFVDSLTGRVYESTTKIPLPENIISQVDASRQSGITRARIGQLAKKGTLKVIVHDGKNMLDKESFEAWNAGRPKKEAEDAVVP
jgi:Transposase IS116/IS110/IS902 family